MFHAPRFGTWICLFVFLSIVMAVVVMIVLLTRQSGPQPPPQGFQPLHKPAQYLVHGVDRATRADKSWHVVADSEANARAKAELEGMVVTAIQFERYV